MSQLKIKPVLLFLIMIIFGSPPAWAQDGLKHPPGQSSEKSDGTVNITHRPLVFLSNNMLPPMIYMQKGKRVGIVVDLAEAIKEHINRPVNVKYMDWSKAQQIVLEGKADALLHINPSKERKELFDFSDDLLESEFSIFINHTREDIYNLNSLRGIQVGVLRKGLCFSLLNQDPSINLVTFPEILSGFFSLKKGEIDAVVMDRQVGSFLLAENNINGIRIVGDPIDRSTSAIAVRKGNTDLLFQINNALAEIKRNGTYAEIIAKWQPKEVIFQTREQSRKQKRFIAMIAFVAGIAILITLLFMLWNKSLKIKVNEHTFELTSINSSLLAEIEERRQAENELKKSEQKFKDFMMSANEGFSLFDADFNLSEINDRAMEIFPPGSTREKIIGKNILSLSPNLKETGRYDKYVEVRDTAVPLYFDDIVPDSVFGDRQLSIKAFQVGSGLGLIFSDNTEQKKVEDKLRYQAAVLQNVSDAVISHDLDFNILSWNEAAENIYGWKSEETVGRSMTDLLQTENNELVKETMLADIREKGVWIGNVVQVRKDGMRRHIQSKVSTLIDENGLVFGYAGVARDITEKMVAEQKLHEYQKRLKALAFQLTIAEEKERRSIAIDLHDRVAQSLALLRIQTVTARKYTSDPILAAKLEDISKTLLLTLQGTRNLMSDLSSSSMDKIGLSAAISEWLENNIENKHNLKTEFIDKMTDDEQDILEDNLQVILFRNVRELVTNTVKHARAKTVSVCIHMDGSFIKIGVTDDGIGFDPDASLENGINSGYGLFSIEERMSDVNGTFKIVSAPRKGCSAVLTVPVRNV
jgi:PAS domain S-box-containing protein